ncbi:MAG: response regulator [Bacteroidia bacterium]
MKIRHLFLEDNKWGNLVYLLLFLSFISIMATGIISYSKIQDSVSSLKNRINDDFELTSIKDIRSKYNAIDNMLEMYLISHDKFYLEQLDTMSKKARYAIIDLKTSSKLSTEAIELMDSLKIYVNEKERNIHQIVRFQQDASIKKLIEDYMNMQSIRSAMDRAAIENRSSKGIWNKLGFKSSKKKKEEEEAIDTNMVNIEKQDLVKMAQSGDINPYLETDHELNLKFNELCKQLESGEINRLDLERRDTEATIRSANNSIMTLGACTAIFILLAGIVYFRYIKKLGQIRRRLSNSKEIAEEMAMIKERFMANMSHEIRTPLNAISGFVDQLHSSELNVKQKKQISIIQKSIQHILNIINDILDFSKLNAGKLTLQKKGFEIAKTVSNSIELLDTLLEDKSVDMQLTIASEVPEILIGDAYRLRQILLNIIGNAIKYTNVGTIHIDLDGKFDSNENYILKICVKDSGIGIDKTELDNIFKEFHMADNARWSKAGSSGLGLSITKMLVELHEGSIDIQSEINRGTSVCSQLPYAVGSKSDLVVENSYLNDLLFLENKSIIIADDEPFNRVLLNNILHKYNAKTFEAENGYHVLSILEKEPIDCILMDVKMPELNGLQTTQRIRKSGNVVIANTPIIAISAALTPDNLRNLMHMDVEHFIDKPFKEGELLNLLHQVLKPGSIEIDHEITETDELIPPNKSFDLYELQKQAGQDQNFIQDMIKTLIHSTHLGITEIELGIQKGDWKDVNITAHRISSPLKYIKAEEVYKSVKQIEYITESGEDIPQDIILNQLNTFKKHFSELEEILETYLKNEMA